MRHTVSLFDQVTLALVGIGSVEPSGLLASSGNIFTPEELHLLQEAGAVGDICLRFFDKSGNPVLTGDYSRGARGFWIEKGQIAYPVAEMTIAGNIRDMWMNLEPANDLELTYGIDAPTLLIGSMTVAGT